MIRSGESRLKISGWVLFEGNICSKPEPVTPGLAVVRLFRDIILKNSKSVIPLVGVDKYKRIRCYIKVTFKIKTVALCIEHDIIHNNKYVSKSLQQSRC